MIPLIAAILTGVAALAAAAVAATLTYRNSQRLARNQAQLAWINRQLGELYGPLYTLLSAGEMTWLAFRSMYRPHGGFFSVTDVKPADRKAWKLWMTVVFMPINRRVGELIVGKGDLLEFERDEVGVPLCLIRYFAHVQGYEAVMAQWEAGDESILVSAVDHPGDELLNYVQAVYTKLKHQQTALLTGLQGSGGAKRFLRSIIRRHEAE